MPSLFPPVQPPIAAHALILPAQTLQHACIALSVVISVFAAAVFVRGIVRMVRLGRAGAPEHGRWNPLGQRIWTGLKVTLTHSTFKNRPLVRAAHWLVMVSFVALFLTLVAAYFQLGNPLFVLPVIGHQVWWAWVTDLMALAGLVSILFLAGVRLVVNWAHRADPRKSRFYGSTTWQARFVEAVVALVCAAVLADHALASAATLVLTGAPRAYPITGGLGASLGADATSPYALANWILLVVTSKILVSMAWMTVTGLAIAMGISWHRFLAPVNIMAGRNADGAKSLGALALPLVDGKPNADLIAALDENPDLSVGLGTTADLTWKDRLDALACTECGRCQDLCPAWNTQKPLSPKLLMLALRDNVVSAGSMTAPGQKHADPADVLGALEACGATGPDGVSADAGPLVPGVVSSEVLWDCTMCGACVEQCPVDIEHVDHVGNLRRYQFLMESSFPRDLVKPMRSLETKANPFGISPRKRLDWARDLSFELPVIGEDLEDAAGLDYLLWVGCAGAFEDKAKKTSAAVAELLHVAGVSFAVLASEGCTGDPARRVGNEALFQMLASSAIEEFQAAKVTRVVATCAHCFNTILNEFPQLGASFEVVHHTQLLNRLMRDGLLRPAPLPENERQAITYHDPCFLGRYNDVFSAPRELLLGLGDVELVEMSQNRERAMCCGAGGGHAFFEDPQPEGSPRLRIADVRMGQAQVTGATQVATACPFCSQMLGSAPTKSAGGGDIEVRDVAMMVLEGVRRSPQGSHLRQ